MAELYKEFCERQAFLHVEWVRVGYVQGNMNNDNALLCGSKKVAKLADFGWARNHNAYPYDESSYTLSAKDIVAKSGVYSLDPSNPTAHYTKAVYPPLSLHTPDRIIFSNIKAQYMEYTFKTGTRSYLPPEVLNRQRTEKGKIKLTFGA